MLSFVANSILNVLYPQECRICGQLVARREFGVACSDCWERTRIFSGREVLCRKCGAYLGTTEKPFDPACGKCNEHLYQKAGAVGLYEHALAASVVDLKKRPFVPDHLKRLLFNVFASSPFTDSDLLVPVPLSAQRLLERGFNQAELIAVHLSGFSGIAIDSLSVARTVHTPMHRAAMDRKAREMTVRNAFEVKRPKLISGARILLVDDIFTTGATASYCAKALKKAGAAEVNVITLARAV
jgi:ComF family protein